MEPSISSTMIQSSEVDTVMDGNELVHASNGNLPNGFMDPQMLTQLDDLDIPDSTPEESPEASQESSEVTTSPAVRQSWKPTGVCYDPRMKMHASSDYSGSPHHPEDPRRIEFIYEALKEAGLIYTGSPSELTNILEESPTKWMWHIPIREARMDEVCLVHTVEHFEWVRALTEKTSAELRQLSSEMDNGRKSLYVGNLTYTAALLSAGGAIETCKNVVAGNLKNGMAVIRPPGHHAEHNESMGFCIFNNVPIAAKVCMADYPETCRKVLILDWDVHHGNGIQNMFYEDPNVLYISLHVWAEGTFYPGRPEEDGVPDGDLDKCGAGRGIGRNINIGWPGQGMGDGEYMAAFQKIVMPIAQEFNPDLVIISAGFDAAAGDDLGGCFVSAACYSHMTYMLMSLAGGKVAVCLEGGYHLPAISRSALAVAKTLMGEPPERIQIPPLNHKAAEVLNQVRNYQAPYWECMRPGVVPAQELVNTGALRLHDVLRGYQKKILNTKHKMVSLYIQRDKLSKSFEDQVLATPGLYNAKKILVIVHDPPEVVATPDPIDNKVYGHNAFVSDGILKYIDWAVAHGYGVLDVNIPQHVHDETDVSSFSPPYNEAALTAQTKELLCYLWDNYLEAYATNKIVLMGVGDSYCGLKMLLTARDCRSKISGVLSFVQGNPFEVDILERRKQYNSKKKESDSDKALGNLRPVKSETDPYLSTWFKSNSLIYVSPDHSCWHDEEMARKVRKNRFGTVVKSDVVGLGAMLRRYETESMEWVNGKADPPNATPDPDETEEEDNVPAIPNINPPPPNPPPNTRTNTNLAVTTANQCVNIELNYAPDSQPLPRSIQPQPQALPPPQPQHQPTPPPFPSQSPNPSQLQPQPPPPTQNLTQNLNPAEDSAPPPPKRRFITSDPTSNGRYIEGPMDENYERRPTTTMAPSTSTSTRRISPPRRLAQVRPSSRGRNENSGLGMGGGMGNGGGMSMGMSSFATGARGAFGDVPVPGAGVTNFDAGAGAGAGTGNSGTGNGEGFGMGGATAGNGGNGFGGFQS